MLIPADTGLVMAIEGHRHTVAWQGHQLACSIKGVLKKTGIFVRVGDRVALDEISFSQGLARITEVSPRQSSLDRPRIANATQVLITVACQQPPFSFETLDRLVIHAQLAGLHPVILLTKTDLLLPPNAEAFLHTLIHLYQDTLGVSILPLSVVSRILNPPEAHSRLRALLQGQLSVLAGPSGVGKSSLLNALLPDTHLKTGDISDKLQRGTHTTRHVALLCVGETLQDGLIADTPGFSQLSFQDVSPITVRNAFREFSDLGCTFDDCLHEPCLQDPEQASCALTVGEQIAASRYASYLAMLSEAKTGQSEREERSQKASFGMRSRDGKQGKTGLSLKLEGEYRQAGRNTQRQQASREIADAEREAACITSEDDFV